VDLQINPQLDDDPKEKSKLRKIQRKDPTLQLIIRTIICILVIDSLIFGYFKIVKKVTVAEGLRGWRASIYKLIGYDSGPEEVTKHVVVNKYIQKPKSNDKMTDNSLHLPEKRSRLESKNTDDDIHDSISIKYKVYLKNGGNIESDDIVKEGNYIKVTNSTGLLFDIDFFQVEKIDRFETVNNETTVSTWKSNSN
jgi:hypothetical protein